MIEAGTKLGRYEIRPKLGAGGMGEVYLTHDSALDRSVALKILPEELAPKKDRMEWFVREAKAAAALTGDVAGSRKAYQDFLALWKDADADLPIPIEAKKEYAALK